MSAVDNLLKQRRNLEPPGFDRRPDEKGIKTFLNLMHIKVWMFDRRPDEKGIKTLLFLFNL